MKAAICDGWPGRMDEEEVEEEEEPPPPTASLVCPLRWIGGAFTCIPPLR